MRQNWKTISLKEVLTERQETPNDEALINGDISVIAKIGFNDGKIQLRTDNNTKTGMILIRPGDLVVSGINAAKGAIAIYGEKNIKPIAATIHYGAYVPNKELADIQYLWFFLRSQTFQELFLKYVPGGIKTELKAKRLLPIPIQLPTLDEQRRIVSRIEELVTKIDEARGLRHQSAEESKALTFGSTKLLSGISINGKLADVLHDKPRNGWSAPCNNMPQGIPVLSLGAVTGFRYRQTEFKRTSEFISPDAHYWLHTEDLLITRSNTPELVGHAAIYNGSPSPCIYPDLMMRLDVDESKANKFFVHHWLSCQLVRNYIKAKSKGTSPTMKKISQGVVMDIPFPSDLSLSEQRRIVTYLDDLQSKVDTLKRLQAETAAELDALLPSILNKAFQGEL
jgi:type I restriction enzyme S subunit